MDNEKRDWLQTVWQIKEKIFQETKNLSPKEFWEFINKETEKNWIELKKRKKETQKT